MKIAAHAKENATEEGFILTIRNVKLIPQELFLFGLVCFILTIRNVKTCGWGGVTTWCNVLS